MVVVERDMMIHSFCIPATYISSVGFVYGKDKLRKLTSMGQIGGEFKLVELKTLNKISAGQF